MKYQRNPYGYHSFGFCLGEKSTDLRGMWQDVQKNLRSEETRRPACQKEISMLIL